MQGNRSLFVINASDSPCQFTLSVYEDEYKLPQTIDAFQTADGFELLGMESVDGVRRLHCRMSGTGVGILDWSV